MAENLLKWMLEVKRIAEEEWSVVVVAFTTDASGESRKARKLLVTRHFPHLLGPDCYAHQVNLIVGDYMKCQAPMLLYGEKATELITWLWSKTYVLALLQVIQINNHINPPPFGDLSVILQWTAHYLAYTCLLELRPSLLQLVERNDREPNPANKPLTHDPRGRAKAQSMIDLIRDEGFWFYSWRYMKSICR